MRQEEECEGVMDSVYVCRHFSLNLCSCLFVCFFWVFLATLADGTVMSANLSLRHFGPD